MDQASQREIERENRSEVTRARTGLTNRDWAIVLGAVVIAAALLGFIYVSDTAGVGPTGIEPAAGTAMTPSYDSDVNNTTGTQDEAPAASAPAPTDTTTDQSPNPAD
jgi:hypothetical protein